MGRNQYVEVGKQNWDTLVSIVAETIVRRADENGFASLRSLADSCLEVKVASENDSGCWLSTSEDMLSFADEEGKEFFANAPYWITVIESTPVPVQGVDDGVLRSYVEEMMVRES